MSAKTARASRIIWNTHLHGVPGMPGLEAAGAYGPFAFFIDRMHSPGGRYRVYMQLPGLGQLEARSDDPDELKAKAERWLEEFVASLGTVFPEPEPEQPKVLGHPDDAAEEWLAGEFEEDHSTVGVAYERSQMIDAFHAGSDWAREQIAKFGRDADGRWITLEPAPDPSPTAVPAEPRED